MQQIPDTMVMFDCIVKRLLEETDKEKALMQRKFPNHTLSPDEWELFATCSLAQRIIKPYAGIANKDSKNTNFTILRIMAFDLSEPLVVPNCAYALRRAMESDVAAMKRTLATRPRELRAILRGGLNLHINDESPLTPDSAFKLTEQVRRANARLQNAIMELTLETTCCDAVAALEGWLQRV